MGLMGQDQLLDTPLVKEAATKANGVLSRSMVCWLGESAVFDGRVEENEYADASYFTWNDDWYEATR